MTRKKLSGTKSGKIRLKQNARYLIHKSKTDGECVWIYAHNNSKKDATLLLEYETKNKNYFQIFVLTKKLGLLPLTLGLHLPRCKIYVNVVNSDGVYIDGYYDQE